MELLFYHLLGAPLERVLPELLQKSLDKGWRVIVETDPPERVEALDTMLWTFRDDSFLPHGKADAPFADEQPILLTNQSDNTNGAAIRFLIDSGDVTVHQGYERIVYMFNGHEERAVERARGQWKAAVDAGLKATYWQQSTGGTWEKKA